MPFSLHVFLKSLIPNGLQIDQTEVTNFLVLCGTIFTIIQFIISIFQQAPYGRYAVSSSKYLNWCPINSKIAWILQECPAFFIPVYLLYEAWDITNISTKILLLAFIIHYFQRTFIFSLLMKSGSKSPLLPTTMAFLFCSFNGFLQSHVLLYDKKVHKEYAKIYQLKINIKYLIFDI